MALPRIDLLINSGRILSLQKEYGDSHGIGQDFFIEAANKALMLVQQEVVNALAETYSQYKEYSITSQTESLTLPVDIFIDDLVYEVRYSKTGDRRDLSDPLRLGYTRGTGRPGNPEDYLVQGGKVWLDPEPISGMVEVRYEGHLPKVSLRKGTVESVTGTLPDLTTIVMVDDSNFNSSDWDILPEYLTVVDWYGNVLMKRIAVDSIDVGTRTVTVRTDFTAEDSETIPVGSYICFGGNASTHLLIPKVGELFVLQFMQDEVNDLLSSDDQPISLAKQESYLRKLIQTYELLPSGPKRIAMINDEGV